MRHHATGMIIRRRRQRPLMRSSVPMVPSAVGLTYYSQVLTFNSAFTGWAVSNNHINLITQTP